MMLMDRNLNTTFYAILSMFCSFGHPEVQAMEYAMMTLAVLGWIIGYLLMFSVRQIVVVQIVVVLMMYRSGPRGQRFSFGGPEGEEDHRSMDHGGASFWRRSPVVQGPSAGLLLGQLVGCQELGGRVVDVSAVPLLEGGLLWWNGRSMEGFTKALLGDPYGQALAAGWRSRVLADKGTPMGTTCPMEIPVMNLGIAVANLEMTSRLITVRNLGIDSANVKTEINPGISIVNVGITNSNTKIDSPPSSTRSRSRHSVPTNSTYQGWNLTRIPIGTPLRASISERVPIKTHEVAFVPIGVVPIGGPRPLRSKFPRGPLWGISDSELVLLEVVDTNVDLRVAGGDPEFVNLGEVDHKVSDVVDDINVDAAVGDLEVGNGAVDLDKGPPLGTIPHLAGELADGEGLKLQGAPLGTNATLCRTSDVLQIHLKIEVNPKINSAVANRIYLSIIEISTTDPKINLSKIDSDIVNLRNNLEIVDTIIPKVEITVINLKVSDRSHSPP
ncbi:hypothetical protein BDK51DRAFT_26126 [Blyttiomyces helicus]|uniref:Uncharacterized protein n=1 Tax=Blyttiomyces helicus TaxID=388810 RepID=A0A4P9WMN3_9FUNG|nr:hypothetical protein BDK51DRAFT_26126 [Blyttiomyces helicus]|eukprot:RKO94341.1 hypothetical protein BDK51DRAFT_26126 [Blyttiomyces helicus]